MSLFPARLLLGALAALVASASHAAPSYLVELYLDPGNGAPIHLGYTRAPVPQSEFYPQAYTPVYFESAPGVVITGADTAGGGTSARTGELAVEARVTQEAQGGTTQYFTSTAEARARAEFVLEDLEIEPVGPGPAPLFTTATFRFTFHGLLPDPTAQGQIHDTALRTNFPDQTFAGVENELQLSVGLRNAAGTFSGFSGGEASISGETRHATGSTISPVVVSGSFAGHEAALQGGSPFVAEAFFIGVPVGEELILTVSLTARVLSAYGFPVNGGLWQGIAEVDFASGARFAAGPVATLAGGLTLQSPSGGIVDNVWVPEPGGGAGAAAAALTWLARARARRRR